MGLNICSVSNDHYYDQEGEEHGEEYKDVSIGYSGYKFFRDALVKYYSKGEFDLLSFLERFFPKGIYNDDNFVVAHKSEHFTEKELKEIDVREYLNTLDRIDIHYPELKKLFPFIVHSDCEGEIPLEVVEDILPLIKKFNKEYKEQNWNFKDTYTDENGTEQFIELLELTIKKKGKIQYL